MGVLYTHMKQAVKRQVSHRLKIIEGQVRGLHALIEDGAYCVDVITQASAIRQALSAIEDVMLENHLLIHIEKGAHRRQSKKAILEVMKIYKLAKKK
jgi:CsoR family transcriptional regulator, copper-sensing transcriptional repressor